MSRPKRSAISRSASAMPTALAMPWPSGPVVVSMPAAWPYSGWPAVRLAGRGEGGRPGTVMGEAPQLVDGNVGEAGKKEKVVEQHRAVTSRQHEAVAVGPVRMRVIEFEEA